LRIADDPTNGIGKTADQRHHRATQKGQGNPLSQKGEQRACIDQCGKRDGQGNGHGTDDKTGDQELQKPGYRQNHAPEKNALIADHASS
jgi:hypothetical protein